MINVIPRVAAIHDISGFGKCSLTVILPILSAMKIETCPLPSALLSTHTGGFLNYSFYDMSQEMEAIVQHWHKLNVKFDCLYTGFLGNVSQVNIILDFIEKFRPQLVLIDPVMADGGKLYSTMSSEISAIMKGLIKVADIITPNATEAAFLSDMAYTDITPISVANTILLTLTQMGAKNVIIKSLKDENKKSYIAMRKSTGDIAYLRYKNIDGIFYGAGDIFTSVLLGHILHGADLFEGAKRAEKFIRRVILRTKSTSDTQNSLLFELEIKSLVRKI